MYGQALMALFNVVYAITFCTTHPPAKSSKTRSIRRRSGRPAGR